MQNDKNAPILITIAVIVTLVVIGVFAYISWSGKTNQAVQDTSNTLETASVETPSITPSVNPIDKAAPAVNPLEKTNPFKNEYKNPFE
ncbi:MAG: hypothetical protein A2836_01945 [Candidatus Taylorbacteria bacterium RIFCSPHIGHO2_01_FULL_45_63]|nr:MAG: hypothetical protein A2836_01945 [Candidatus Taylorbacteria bacterium RIFCSPHIGHO2_01_FULL_45_63]OHA35016.1 MAG: hypothetical protein A3A22_02295 [Candidatus Taylorbacteria bacterium RIFCSPLOWO2_01_FULL_45_34b]